MWRFASLNLITRPLRTLLATPAVGRAVIGGLAMATFATLFFVPVMYSLLRQKPPETQVEEELR